MILSNVLLQEALDKGWIKITPQPQPRRPETGLDCPYQTTAVDLRLGTEVSFFKPGLPIQIDLRRGKFAALAGPNTEIFTITEQQPFTLLPNHFVIAKTLERIELPILEPKEGPCLAARVEGRSSYARCGLLVHLTAPTIHAGYEGTITLELINLGIIPILLTAHMPICQLIVGQVCGVPFRNDSQFQGQRHAAGTK